MKFVALSSRKNLGNYGCPERPQGRNLYDQSRLSSRVLERATGIEPVTSSLGSWHSTAELRPLRPRVEVQCKCMELIIACQRKTRPRADRPATAESPERLASTRPLNYGGQRRSNHALQNFRADGAGRQP